MRLLGPRRDAALQRMDGRRINNVANVLEGGSPASPPSWRSRRGAEVGEGDGVVSTTALALATVALRPPCPCACGSDGAWVLRACPAGVSSAPLGRRPHARRVAAWASCAATPASLVPACCSQVIPRHGQHDGAARGAPPIRRRLGRLPLFCVVSARPGRLSVGCLSAWVRAPRRRSSPSRVAVPPRGPRELSRQSFSMWQFASFVFFFCFRISIRPAGWNAVAGTPWLDCLEWSLDEARSRTGGCAGAAGALGIGFGTSAGVRPCPGRPGARRTRP